MKILKALGDGRVSRVYNAIRIYIYIYIRARVCGSAAAAVFKNVCPFARACVVWKTNGSKTPGNRKKGQDARVCARIIRFRAA